jgi:hypothetical protein
MLRKLDSHQAAYSRRPICCQRVSAAVSTWLTAQWCSATAVPHSTFGVLIEHVCAELDFGQAYYYNHTILEDISLAEIKQAALSGCELCVLMRHGLLDGQYPDSPVPRTPLLDTALIRLSLSWDRCHPDFAPTPAQCYGLQLSFQGDRSRSIDIAMLALSSDNARNPHVSRSRSNWNPSLWRSWVEDCTGKHGSCEATGGNRYTPTRLIDLSSGAETLRLIESCGNLAGYVALSHCWGGSLPLTTTPINYHAHLEAIPFGDMPATFQDAVKVARAIGYQYLWIDCLCIIQDSEPDWLRECVVMGQVYAGAAATIAASQSTSPADGLFKTADGPNHACHIPAYWPSTGQNDTLVVELPTQPQWRPPEYMVNGPLSKRGWAIQERLLSQRVLHMSGSGILFECTSSVVMDRLPWPKSIGAEGRNAAFIRGCLRLDSQLEVIDNWHHLISNYSNRNLTYARDRLPAISGIARILAERMGWKYLAGLWSEDIVAGLLWYIEDPNDSLAANASGHSGPSWSWASTNKSVNTVNAWSMGEQYTRDWFEGRESLSRLRNNDFAHCIEVRDWTMELVGEDQFAEVKSGRLTVFGHIRLVTIRQSERPARYRGYRDISFPFGPATGSRYYPDSQEPLGDPNSTIPVWCLLLGFQLRYSTSITCYMLALQPVPGRTATFKRIGFVNLV